MARAFACRAKGRGFDSRQDRLSARAPTSLAQFSLAEPDQCADAAELHAGPEAEPEHDDQEDESSHVIKRYPFLYQCLAMAV